MSKRKTFQQRNKIIRRVLNNTVDLVPTKMLGRVSRMRYGGGIARSNTKASRNASD